MKPRNDNLPFLCWFAYEWNAVRKKFGVDVDTPPEYTESQRKEDEKDDE